MQKIFKNSKLKFFKDKKHFPRNKKIKTGGRRC